MGTTNSLRPFAASRMIGGTHAKQTQLFYHILICNEDESYFKNQVM